MKFLQKWKIPKREISIGLLTLLVLGVSFLIFENTSVPTARKIDIQFGFYSIFTTFVLLCIAFVINAKDFFVRLFKNLPRFSSLIYCLFIIGFFSIFIFSNVSNTHRVLSDETSWESMALQMYFEHSGGVCNEGEWKDGFLDCKTEVNNFKGKALALVEMFAYALSKPGRDAALQVNFPLYVFSLLAFFLAMSVWLKSDKLALAGTVFLAGMPILLLQSRSASTEVLYIALLSFLMLWYALVKPNEVTGKHFLLTVPLLGLFAQTRQETVFAFIPFALYYTSYFRGKFYRLPLFVASTILLSWPSINTMAAYRGYDFQGGEHAAHSLENFWFNIKSNITIMLNLEKTGDSILKNPFYTSFTILLLIATVWLLVRTIGFKKYRRGAILAAFFSLQIFVVLLNVSGTFEIDINQRYVLIALPLFALIMALGFCDFTHVVTKWNWEKSGKLTFIFALILTVFLTAHHSESFRSNMLYHRNKLLGEEDFLHKTLSTYPENSIFIYARPWQMLASGHSSFSERTFLNWSDDTFKEKMFQSEGNIYLVRGQDGRGSVNRKSRVVGFKTTDQIERIFNEYRTENKLLERHLFGYPLSIDKILSKRGLSPYRQGLLLSEWDNNTFTIRKTFPDSLFTYFFWNDSLLFSPVLNREKDSLFVEPALVRSGLNTARFECFLPDGDTLIFYRDIFKKDSSAELISEWEMKEFYQDWSKPQKDKSVDLNPISLGDRVFRYGIGSHAPSKLLYVVPAHLRGGHLTLHGTVGLDNESACGDGAVFILLADGKELTRTKRLYSEESILWEIPLGDVSEIELRTEEGKDKDCDHADYANLWVSKQ